MKNTTRRSILASGFAASGALAVAACGAQPAATPAARTRPAVSMEYWSRWPQPAQTEVEEKRVTEWNEANAPTKFTRTGMTGDYIEKLNTAAAAGSMPDAYTVGGTGIPNFSAKGVALAGIDKYPSVQKELSDFFEPTINASKYQGKLNGLPYIVDIRNMIVRKDLMQQAGLDPNKFPETWDGLRDAARRMTKKSGDVFSVVGFGMPKSGWPAHDLFMVLHEQQGEHPFSTDLTKPTFNGAAGRSALQQMVDILNRDQVDTFKPPAPPSGVNAIGAGLQAMTYDSTGPVSCVRRAVPEVAANLMAAPIPKLKQRVTYMGGTYVMAASTAKDAASAVDLLLYLTAGKHADEINSIQNAVPPRKSAGKSPYVSDPLIKPFYDAVAYGWSVPNHGFYTEIREVIVREIDAAMKVEKSVQVALDEAARGVQEYLTRK